VGVETSGVIVDVNSDLAAYYGIYKEVPISKGIPVKDVKYDIEVILDTYMCTVKYSRSILKEFKNAADSFIVANFCAYRILNSVD